MLGCNASKNASFAPKKAYTLKMKSRKKLKRSNAGEVLGLKLLASVRQMNANMRARQSSVLMGARYPATIDKQPDGSFMVSFVDLPNTFTEGETKEEALNNASEVLSGMLAWHLESATFVPPPVKV